MVKKKQLVNKWSLLFQKGTQVYNFAFFQFFVIFFSSDDYVEYIFFHLWNNAQLLLGADFLLDV